MSHVLRPVGIQLGPIAKLVLSELPTKQGLYIFYGGQQTLYVGEAGNLRLRIEKHLDHSDNKGLARWFWENGFSEVNLELQKLPENTSKKVRRALEAELITSRHPLFNILRP
jgi:excinuclease UvrABC nuclease subunit